MLLAWTGAGCCGHLAAYPLSPEWDRARARFVNPVDGVEPGIVGVAARIFAPSSRLGDGPVTPPQVANDGRLLREGTLAPSVTWIGHSTVLIQVGGRNILTDPVYAEELLGLPRLSPPGVPLSQLPPIDVVVISHDHRDHLDEDTIREIGNGPLYVVPLGIGPWLSERGISNVVELDWWQSVAAPPTADGRGAPLRITLVPALHWSRRGLCDAGKRLWTGFVFESGDLTIYFAGDTGYGIQFREIAARFPRINLALLPVGSYAPRSALEPQHMSPQDAAQAARDLDAEAVVPIHWGTFRDSSEPVGEPPWLLLKSLGSLSTRAWVLPIGGILRLRPLAASDDNRSSSAPAGDKP